MNILDPTIRLIDALSGWGLREAALKYGMEVPSDESQRTMLGMDVVLRHVPELIARILHAEPLGVAEHRGVLKVDFGPEESNLLLHNGATLAEYIGQLNAKYVRTLVETPDFAPLVCTVQVAEDDTDLLVGAVVVYDGWHRAAAWLTRVHEGSPYRLTAHLIKTKHPFAPASGGVHPP